MPASRRRAAFPLLARRPFPRIFVRKGGHRGFRETRPAGGFARREGETARIEVEDTGRGMSEQFIREQLFKPFESTKDHGMGIGAEFIAAIVPRTTSKVRLRVTSNSKEKAVRFTIEPDCIAIGAAFNLRVSGNYKLLHTFLNLC